MNLRRWIIAGVVAVLSVAAVAAGLLFVNLNIAPSAGGYASRIEGVQYYPACGNEVLEFEGRTWYPIVREEWTTPTDLALDASGGRGIAVRVQLIALPEPGEDVGTLYVWNTGRAYWVSDSGELSTWLTLVPQSYNWVC